MLYLPRQKHVVFLLHQSDFAANGPKSTRKLHSIELFFSLLGDNVMEKLCMVVTTASSSIYDLTEFELSEFYL